MKKLFLKISQYLQERPVLETLFIQNFPKIFRATILNIYERLLLKMLMKLREVKNRWEGILTLHEKQDFSAWISETSENMYLFVFISFLFHRVCIYINISLMWWGINSKQQVSIPELIKRRSKVQEKNIS